MISLSLPTAIKPWFELMRFHRPIGILLLLWPTWWALWLAAGGLPDLHLFIIFTLGTAVMRAAGCVVNDITDRNFDPHVERTKGRPLASGALTVSQAIKAFIGLGLVALVLVAFTNPLTIYLSFAAVAVACIYPYMKRHTHLPQVVLGVAFSMGIPMAFTAQTGSLPPEAVLVFVTNLLWTVAYDTFYGMTDREYDKRIGVKSTAILFEGNEMLITGCLQVMTIVGLWMMGQRFELGFIYGISIVVAAGFMVYQQWLLKKGKPDAYFAAFLNNNWVGLVIFTGIFFDLLLLNQT